MTLSAREVEVMECAANGMTVLETAKHLGIAQDTVKHHRDRVRTKVGGHGKGAAYAVAECFRRGYIAPDAVPNPIRLSPQCRRILVMMCTGMDNAEIGGVMFITLNSVKTHNRRIFKRLSARNREHAVAIALRTGTVRFMPRPRTTNGTSDA